MLKHIKFSRYYFDLIGYINIVFTILIVPIAYVLPKTISWENGLLENLQVIILLVGELLSLGFYKKSCQNKIHHMWLWVSGVFFLLVGRELSWGRVFFQTKITEAGPEFIPMSQVPHHMLINVCIGFFIVMLVAGLINTVPWRIIFTKIPIPKLYLCLVVIGAVFSTIGDHGWIFLGYKGENVEELGELLVYFLMDMLGLYYYHYLNEEGLPE